MDPVRDYDNFKLDDEGNLKFECKNERIDIGNINEDLNSPSKMIKKLGVQTKINGL